MKKSYGLGWQGSKSKLAKWVLANLPKGGTLCEPFAGGCAVTHAALEVNQFDSYIINDITGSAEFFRECICEKLAPLPWVSREDFPNLPEHIRRAFYAFNTSDSFLYSRALEPLAKALYERETFGTTDGLRALGLSDDRGKAEEETVKYIDWYVRKTYGSREKYEDLREKHERQQGEARHYLRDALEKSGLTQAYINKDILRNYMSGHYFGVSQWYFPTEEAYGKLQEVLPLALSYAQAVESFGILKEFPAIPDEATVRNLLTKKHSDLTTRQFRARNLFKFNQQKDKIKALRGDYRDAIAKAPRDAVVYCDIPYAGTAGYSVEFDHAAFCDYCRNSERLIIISSYEMPADFICIARTGYTSQMTRGSVGKKVAEKLFIPAHQRELYETRMETRK